MTIAQFAYETQQYLQAETGTTFIKRAHIYELLSAALGFNSYAAFCAESVFLHREDTAQQIAAHVERLGRRSLDLQYPPTVAIKIAEVLPQFLIGHGVGSIRVLDLISQLRGDAYFDSDNEHEARDLDDDEEFEREMIHYIDMEDDTWPSIRIDASPLMLDGLSTLAERGDVNAHYALALLHAPSDDDDFGNGSAGSEYWYNEAQKGRVLTGVELEWAAAHATTLDRAKKYEHHLRAAGAMGHAEALLELAERFGDETFFESAAIRPEDIIDPAHVADIANELGRYEDVYRWCTEAAKRGDVKAMRELIESFDRANPLKCWTWFYLAKMRGVDLSKDRYVAIGDDGRAYDDDVGGPLYADGQDGVKLTSISDEDDEVARQMADTLFQGVARVQ